MVTALLNLLIMKKQLLKVKGNYVLGVFVPSHIFLTAAVLKLEQNKNVSLKGGWYELSDCECPEPTPEGYYRCILGNCIFFPS